MRKRLDRNIILILAIIIVIIIFLIYYSNVLLGPFTGQFPGTCSGATCPVSVPGQFGNALNFDGVDDFVTLGSPNIVAIDGVSSTNQMTISAWVNQDDFDNLDSKILSRTSGILEQDYDYALSTMSSGTVSSSLVFDAASSAQASVAGVSSISTTHTASGIDRLVIISVGTSGGVSAPTVTSVTYGSQPATLINTATVSSVAPAGSTYRTTMFSLPAPATGAQTVTATLSGPSDETIIAAASFNGAHQTAPLGTAVINSGTTATPTVTVSSAPGEIVIDGFFSGRGTNTVDPSQIERWSQEGVLGGFAGGGGSTKAGASSVTMSWTISGASWTNAWADIAVSVKPASTTTTIGPAVPQFRLKTTIGGTSTLTASSTATLQPGVWTHLTATYDGNFMRLYKDGVEVGSLPKTGTVVNTVGKQVWIGNNPPSGGGAFDGRIDDVGIFSAGLSVSEIQNIMTNGISGTGGNICGNGLLEGAEQCDAGAQNGNVCTANYGQTCTSCNPLCNIQTIQGPTCGDGIIQTPPESCDQGGGNIANNDGCSSTCQIESGYTCSGQPSVCTLVQPPTAPTSLTLTVNSAVQITLSWTDTSTNENGFFIERSSDGIVFNQIAQVGAGITTYINSALQPSTTYYYRVRAFNSAGNSGYTNVAFATTQAPPVACGNGIIEPANGEQCDGTNLGGATCSSVLGAGYTGTLSCSAGCTFVTTACVPPVNNPPVISSATGTPSSGTAPLSVQFNVAATDPEGGALTYSWNFADGTTSTLQNPLHTYSLAGTYTAVVTVSDIQGAIASNSVPITVSGPLCVLTNAFWTPTNAVEGQIVTLTVTGTNCLGKTLNFAVLEIDRGLEIGGDDPVNINPPSATFTGTSLSVNWAAEWECDGAIGGVCVYGNPEYIFRASVAGETNSINSEGRVNGQLITTEVPPTCGNGFVQSGEQCDVGANNGNPSAQGCNPAYGQFCSYCSSSCTNQILQGPNCGDGIVQSPPESCEGNSINTCVTPAGYQGTQTCLSQFCYWSTCASSQSCGDFICNGPETTATCPGDCPPGTISMSSTLSGLTLIPTLSASLTANTQIPATCRYSTTNQPYSSMTNVFSQTGTTSHSQLISVIPGQSYTYYVQCSDGTITTTTALQIPFSVQPVVFTATNFNGPLTNLPITPWVPFKLALDRPNHGAFVLINDVSFLRNIDFNTNVQINKEATRHVIQVDSAAISEVAGKPVQLFFFGVTYTNPVVYREGLPCGSNCTTPINITNTTYMVNTTAGFSTYTLQDANCTSGQTRACGVGVCSTLSETCSSAGTWPGCNLASITGYSQSEVCDDGLDNNCNGQSNEGCPTYPPGGGGGGSYGGGGGGGGSITPQCNNNRDDDNDGKCDADGATAGVNGCSGQPDPGCTSPTDTSELDSTAQPGVTTFDCSDGIDNDSDGLTDFPQDDGCDSLVDNDETTPTTGTQTPETGGISAKARVFVFSLLIVIILAVVVLLVIRWRKSKKAFQSLKTTTPPATSQNKPSQPFQNLNFGK